MKSFHTFSMAILTFNSLASGMALRISMIERFQQSSKLTCLLTALPAVIEADLLVDHARHQQHGRGAVSLRVLERLQKPFQALLPCLQVGMRQRLAPVGVAANAGRFQSALVER